MTDLALEMAALCNGLDVAANEPGDDFLARTFEVDAWSTDFLQVLISIHQRLDQLQNVVDEMTAAPSIKADAEENIKAIRRGFDRGSLQNKWAARGQTAVKSERASLLRALSVGLPNDMRFPELSEEERLEVVGMAETLLTWLKDAQLAERDFIREAIIGGLEQFLFRMDKIRWFGWGYSVESLRDVIMAYLALEGGIVPNEDPNAEAALKKLGKFLKGFYSYTQEAKSAAETGQWLLSLYNTISRVAPAGGGYIAGLLT